MHICICIMLYTHWMPLFGEKKFIYRGLGILFSIWLLQNMRFTRAENVLHLAWNVQNRVGFWGSAPDPPGEAYDAPPDPIVVRGFLPSAISVSCLRRLLFFQLGRSMIKEIRPPTFLVHITHRSKLVYNNEIVNDRSKLYLLKRMSYFLRIDLNSIKILNCIRYTVVHYLRNCALITYIISALCAIVSVRIHYNDNELYAWILRLQVFIHSFKIFI